MGGRPVVAALKGITVGFLTPFCTYSALPLLMGLRRARVAPAGYVASSCSTDSEMPWAGTRIESRSAARSASTIAVDERPAGGRRQRRASHRGIPVAAALGTPMYFNTELFVPIADSLETAEWVSAQLSP